MTYAEQSQRVYFQAARDLRKIACSVLNDVQNEVELTSETTLRWAIRTAKLYADKAKAAEDLGYERCIVSSRAENVQYNSRQAYSQAIDAFEDRVKAIPGGVYLLGVVKHGAELAAAHASAQGVIAAQSQD